MGTLVSFCPATLNFACTIWTLDMRQPSLWGVLQRSMMMHHPKSSVSRVGKTFQTHGYKWEAFTSLAFKSSVVLENLSTTYQRTNTAHNQSWSAHSTPLRAFWRVADPMERFLLRWRWMNDEPPRIRFTSTSTRYVLRHWTNCTKCLRTISYPIIRFLVRIYLR